MESRDASNSTANEQIVVRRATAADQGSVRGLFDDDRKAVQVLEDDDGADVYDLAGHYLNDLIDDEPASCFWVAEHGGSDVIGMVGVRRLGESRGQVRRLLVRSDWRNKGVGGQLVEQALRFCSDRGYVKVTLHTQVDQQAAIGLFQRFGFQLNRTRNVDGREMMEFYLDLYRSPSGDD